MSSLQVIMIHQIRTMLQADFILVASLSTAYALQYYVYGLCYTKNFSNYNIQLLLNYKTENQALSILTSVLIYILENLFIYIKYLFKYHRSGSGYHYIKRPPSNWRPFSYKLIKKTVLLLSLNSIKQINQPSTLIKTLHSELSNKCISKKIRPH